MICWVYAGVFTQILRRYHNFHDEMLKAVKNYINDVNRIFPMNRSNTDRGSPQLLNKRVGEIVQVTRWDVPLVKLWLYTLLKGITNPSGVHRVVHRLDRPVSGIVLFAKHQRLKQE